MANLTQLGMLERLDGILPVDKPAGISFSTVVKTVKRKFNLVKVGHGGSLDTMASGLLLLLVNGANKFADGVTGADREWEGVMRLGVKTDTCDVHGRVLADAGTVVPPEKTAAAVAEFRGDVFQTEPRYCAVRREGASDWEIADTGEHPRHLAHVYRLRTSPAGDGRLAFSVLATKSLVVRALVGDFGDALGCGACLESLRRTAIGKFKVADAVPFARLLETETKDFASCVTPLTRALL
ncbi:MAG: tRNA pseudouridine(55) synthase TruB [Kiritimatiellae bacterium]|nr:tRNA pseudouridine(55) synthase TruB [Kiritimatiellia bacterium]